ncbi:MAG: oxygen-dependent coproporphyrinogen oxidase [Planctomycetes bacterium]|nr:oxygen-dependent coproporphyrinogen oxidase [Planctomycetota bacterium]
MSAPDRDAARAFLTDLQDRICDALEGADGQGRFRREEYETHPGSINRPRVLEDGPVIEKAAVNFSHTRGDALPEAATARKPELAGVGFEALSVSLIVHPRNPYAPTTHMNLRFFTTTPDEGPEQWWFGGGFDLTPYYGFEEDAVHWHRTAKAACDPTGPKVYAECKAACDEYFYLPWRGEARGIGGIFFDDWDRGGFEAANAFWERVGDQFLLAYVPVLERRKETAYGGRERDFQLYRRGRYAEFNLALDRGTRYGLQSGGRIESILASLPPAVAWRYDWRPEPGTSEAALYDDFLPPRDWI